MSFREEERQRSAAAAIGVGIGTAMYYFFSQRRENPHGEGSADPGRRSESLEGQNFAVNIHLEMEVDSDEYTPISENETTDTSVHDVDSNDSDDDLSNNSFSFNGSNVANDNETDRSDHSFEEDTEMSSSNGDFTPSFSETESRSSNHFIHSLTDTSSMSSESDMTGWDVTSESEGVPEYTGVSTSVMDHVLGNIRSMYSRRSQRSHLSGHRMNIEREQYFRDRPWTNEKCSICSEVINLSQEVLALHCTHRFHRACILPWLQETCPNCRRRAE